MNFIEKYTIRDKKLCDELIKYHNDNKEYKREGVTLTGIDKNVKDSIDVIFHNTSKNESIQKYFNEISSFAQQYMHKYKIISNLNTEYGNNIQYYPPGGGYKDWHYERTGINNGFHIISHRQLVYMTYLNDVNDGGETEFMYQKIKFKPKKGLTLIWPTDFTHYHRGIPSPTQYKYITTGWFVFT